MKIHQLYTYDIFDKFKQKLYYIVVCSFTIIYLRSTDIIVSSYNSFLLLYKIYIRQFTHFLSVDIKLFPIFGY